MTTKLLLIIESDIKPGKEQELRDIVHELCDFVERSEPGTLRYDWFISSETQTIRLIEEYESMSAAAFHGTNYAPYREKLDLVRTVRRRTVCGDLTDDIKDSMRFMEPEFYEPLVSPSAKTAQD